MNLEKFHGPADQTCLSKLKDKIEKMCHIPWSPFWGWFHNIFKKIGFHYFVWFH